MSEIEPGEYIRTKDGIIAKVTYVDSIMIDCDKDVFELDDLSMMEIPTEYKKEYVLKHSPNIIYLIEEGDYVNGEKVYSIGIATGDYKIINLTSGKFIFEEDIKTVITHEQIERMEYKL